MGRHWAGVPEGDRSTSGYKCAAEREMCFLRVKPPLWFGVLRADKLLIAQRARAQRCLRVVAAKSDVEPRLAIYIYRTLAEK